MGHKKGINTYAKNPDYRGAGRRPQGSCFAGGCRAADLRRMAPRRVLSRGFLLCHSGPGALCGARRGRCCQAREPSGGRPRTPSTWAEDTHLEHDFIDGSSVGFKVEVFIVVIA